MADLGLVELAHDPRHGPAFAIRITGAGAAELLARRVVADLLQRLVIEEAVQEGRVRRVDADLEALQPVGVPQALEGEGMGGGRGKAVELGERWRLVGFAKPAKEDAAFLQHRVAALLHAITQLAAGGLGRCVQALAVDVELPAVERAAQAVALGAAEGKVGAAVRAVTVQQAPGAGRIPEQHQVLAHDFHGLDRALRHARVQGRVEFIHQGNWLPVTAQDGTAGGTGAGACEQVVLFGFHVWFLKRYPEI